MVLLVVNYHLSIRDSSLRASAISRCCSPQVGHIVSVGAMSAPWCCGIVAGKRNSSIVVPCVLSSHSSSDVNREVVLRRASYVACLASRGVLGVSRSHVGSISARPAVSIDADRFIMPCRCGAASCRMLGGSGSSPGLPSPCHSSFDGRSDPSPGYPRSVVGLDGPAAVLEALLVLGYKVCHAAAIGAEVAMGPPQVVGGIRASHVSIDGVSSALGSLMLR